MEQNSEGKAGHKNWAWAHTWWHSRVPVPERGLCVPQHDLLMEAEQKQRDLGLVLRQSCVNIWHCPRRSEGERGLWGDGAGCQGHSPDRSLCAAGAL